MKRWTLGLNPGSGGFNYHDPAAALFDKTTLVAAAEEERFNRHKSSAGHFPTKAIASCLEFADITMDEVDRIAIGYEPEQWKNRLVPEVQRALKSSGLMYLLDGGSPVSSTETINRVNASIAELSSLVNRYSAWASPTTAKRRILQKLGRFDKSVEFVPHHTAHVVASWAMSDYRKTGGLVVDGIGEAACVSGWTLDEQGPHCLFETLMPDSLGYLFAAVTEYIGFKSWQEEGKVMALAPYGVSDRALSDQMAEVTATPGNLVSQILNNGLALDTSRAKAIMAATLGKPARRPEEPISDFHKAVARAAQDQLEAALLHLARRVVDLTESPTLCVGGGVFLNCKANGMLRQKADLEDLFLFPVSGDAGLAFGAAAALLASEGHFVEAPTSLQLGPDCPPRDEIAAKLNGFGVHSSEPSDLPETVALLLADGKIVFWYQGRAEFGPRALGGRSILCDPRDSSLAERVNCEIKRRETWRPFAPAILSEYIDDVVPTAPRGQRLYMVEAFSMSEAWAQRAPGVVHSADGSTRPQSVHSDTQPLFHSILRKFHSMTGIPFLLNTSLNGPGEPLANSPEDALRLFYSSTAEVLIIGPFLVRKKSDE